MSKGWSTERRARQAALVQKWKPWKQSTGPKSQTGKSIAAYNAYKGGQWKIRRQKLSQLSKLLKQQKDVIKNFI